MIFQDKKRSLKHLEGHSHRFRRGLLEGFLELVSFIVASKKFKIKYHNRKLLKIVKTINIHTKGNDLVL
jgi:hypothetical protein